MSLLTIIQGATDSLGLTRPTSAFTSTDQQIIQLVGLAQREGKELAQRHTWQVLVKECTFSATATSVQTSSATPSDFGRFIDDTFFNRSKKRAVFGPVGPQDWQFNQSVVSAVIIESFRQRGGNILLTPTPTQGDSYAYEYVGINWCQSSLGVAQSAWASDTDTGILSEELMTLGIVWRFLRAKGFDYAEPFRSYEMQVAQAISRDGGKRTLNAGRTQRLGVRAPYVQDGSWPL